MIEFSMNRGRLENFSRANENEWIITNGLGGFASGTPTLANARKYHGLLVASFNPPADRYLTLSKIDEEISTETKDYYLSANLYANGVIQPTGHLYLENFTLDPNPRFTYSCAGIIIEKKIFMPNGKNAVAVKYSVLEAPAEFTFKLYPQVTFRDFHGNTNADTPDFSAVCEGRDRKLKIKFKNERLGEKILHICSDRAVFKSNEIWNRGLVLQKEVERGEDHAEDLFSPGRFTVKLKKGDTFYMGAAAGEDGCEKVFDCGFGKIEKKNAKELSEIAAFPGAGPCGQKLAYSASSFIVERASTGKKTVIAGYHWFSDWGRDTMISLPGLTLINGRFDVCRDILETFSDNIKNGIVPNRFPDDSKSPTEYNTVDASLWYFHAIYRYYKYTGDVEFVKKLMPGMREIIKAYSEGTDFNIKMDPEDGLISQGSDGYQLTWMDAKVNGYVVTPRTGKPVEINALWYNALCVMDFFENLARTGYAFKYAGLIEKAGANFERKFFNASGGYLYDVLGDGADAVGKESLKIRPNQIFAVSLPFSSLGAECAKAVVVAVEKKLLTPYGLRSLAPEDPDYIPHYRGDRYKRDCAYHQGTVWAYLIGPFITAKLKVEGRSAESVERCRKMLEPLEKHLECAGLLSVSEIFDAEAPYAPAGCISQAWSVAELSRALYEDIGGAVTPY